MSVSWAQVIRRNPDAPARVIDGTASVLEPDSNVVHTLSETATFIWERADGTLTLEQIAGQLLEEFDVDEATLRADALSFVEDMVEHGLLLVEAARS